MTRSAMWLVSLGLWCTGAMAQSKKPLDHSVYDSWQNIGVKMVSPDGRWAVYTVTPQEGDATLYIRNLQTNRQFAIERGAAPVITEDSRYVAFSIKPRFQETRQARIKKAKPDDMPKDSLALFDLETGKTILQAAKVKSFKTPEKGSGLLAYLVEPAKDTTSKKTPAKPAPAADFADADDDGPGKSGGASTGDLIIVQTGKSLLFDTIKNVSSYTVSKPGNALTAVVNPGKKDSLAQPGVLLWNPAKRERKFISKGHGQFAQFAFDEKGEQLAWTVSRDSAKAPVTVYALAFYGPGMDTARLAISRTSSGMRDKWSVSENGNIAFSRNGQRIFFGTAPIPKPKDTTIVDFEVAKVDVWHYLDDYLQPMQLKNLDRELKRNYTAVYFPAENRMVQLGDDSMEDFRYGDEGNAEYGLGTSDSHSRVAMQWTGKTNKNAWMVHIPSGRRMSIKQDLNGQIAISPSGKYIIWFDNMNSQYSTYDFLTGSTRIITAAIPEKLTDEENDVPDFPSPYGTSGWMENDKYVYINDRYDIWQVDPSGKEAPVMVTQGIGRAKKTVLRNVKLNMDERFFIPKQTLLLESQADSTKHGGYWTVRLLDKAAPKPAVSGPYAFTAPIKAKNASMVLYQRSTYQESPDVFAGEELSTAKRISQLNPQQQQYNWGTAELFKWKTFNGQETEGIVYKPEDFDPSKKYPVLIYFYEKLTDGLYGYQPPAPTPSRLNITFFVSRGYVVLAPDIRYENGHPGKSAYDYIVSGAEALAKNPWIDRSNMAIQGQSWGGYQVCYLVTATPLFKAAWAGAPVANMTSAYGGIRWESGMNRQFQYEHTQSRIGATLWDKPELYIENSPLFHLPKVTTPLVIMHNDADGAVPWYQGIEMFTGLRRLGKPVWMLNYNGDAHNLMQRQNRKDIQVRQQQFFDHYLKGAPAPKWLSKGVPATDKGRDWGFDVE
ncbi:S9 family peptidase [Chitinophaga caseinilytica]|uniref:Prolyl oligopeptidase family serine peptidase n=1 Tax=Chitinophaga caseinilytica TaxID=2267521 RepID=A0ABZ2Z9M7_9BACT